MADSTKPECIALKTTDERPIAFTGSQILLSNPEEARVILKSSTGSADCYVNKNSTGSPQFDAIAADLGLNRGLRDGSLKRVELDLGTDRTRLKLVADVKNAWPRTDEQITRTQTRDNGVPSYAEWKFSGDQKFAFKQVVGAPITVEGVKSVSISRMDHDSYVNYPSRYPKDSVILRISTDHSFSKFAADKDGKIIAPMEVLGGRAY